jgi:hypothetical protein
MSRRPSKDKEAVLTMPKWLSKRQQKKLRAWPDSRPDYTKEEVACLSVVLRVRGDLENVVGELEAILKASPLVGYEGMLNIHPIHLHEVIAEIPSDNRISLVVTGEYEHQLLVKPLEIALTEFTLVKLDVDVIEVTAVLRNIHELLPDFGNVITALVASHREAVLIDITGHDPSHQPELNFWTEAIEKLLNDLLFEQIFAPKLMELKKKGKLPFQEEEEHRQPGRKPHKNYDKAFDLIRKGASYEEAWEWYCKEEGLSVYERSAYAAFKEAMKRRRKKARQ